MRVFQELFTSTSGLMSLLVIAIALGIGAYIWSYVAKQIRHDTEKFGRHPSTRT